MKHQEKKYRVENFDDILRRLLGKSAVKGRIAASTHYYAKQPSNDVVKLVDHGHKYEIHILKESEGKFKLVDRIPVDSVDAGLAWLKNKGYTEVNIVKMAHTDYEYKGGIVGLYVIDELLHSVILDYPREKHDELAREFGLENTIVIELPYNKYLEGLGKLRSMKFV